MRVALVHGYLLNDSGSGTYIREMSKSLVQKGHEITLVCQEKQHADFDFINSLYEFDAGNEDVKKVCSRDTKYNGFCRLVRPNIDGKLLTFVAGNFEGFASTTFQEAPKKEIDDYVQANIKAAIKIFDTWPQDMVLANHIIMQPYVVFSALEKKVPVVVLIQGSALNFSVKTDPRLVPYAIKGLDKAKTIAVQSNLSLKDTIGFAKEHGLEVAQKTQEIVPGVDSEIFRPPTETRPAVRDHDGISIEKNDDVLLYVGGLVWTKGIHYILTALPIMLQRRPSLKMIIAGRFSGKVFKEAD